METNKAITKITKMCKKARLASLLLFCFCIAAGAALIFAAATAFPDVRTAVKDPDGSVKIYSAAMNLSKYVQSLVLVVLYGAGLEICSNMFAGISENGTPFRNETADALKKISVIMVLSGILPGFIGGVCGLIIYLAAHTSESLRVIISNCAFTVGAVPLFIAIFLFVMTEVFRYGCLLQQESDETL